MSSSDGKFNYAHAYGIESVAAAVTFAALYATLLPLYLVKQSRHQTKMFFLLFLCCAIRVVSFVFRAALAGSDTAGENFALCVVAQIAYTLGSFDLYAVYELIHEREELDGRETTISRVLNRFLVRLVVVVAASIEIGADAKRPAIIQPDQHISDDLERVSNIIFLVFVVILLLYTLSLIIRGVGAHRNDTSQAIGAVHGMKIFFVIVVLFAIKVAYLLATVGKARPESEWYPLAALTEFLAIVLVATPQLLPNWEKLYAHSKREQSGRSTTLEVQHHEEPLGHHSSKGATSSPTEKV